MKLQVNDEFIELEGNTITDLIVISNLQDKTGFAIAVNEEVITKSKWHLYELRENDSVLIIQPTQGG
ncbi:MAG: sulfur carrier protein ThiS [Proteobacteria bacterium]|nr:sulfur carrier protein ThiS [Pseudomonadota bacterium]